MTLDNTILKGDSDYSWIKFLIEAGHVDQKEYETRNNDYFYDQYYEGKLDHDEWAEFCPFNNKRKEQPKILKTKSMNFLRLRYRTNDKCICT